MRAGLLVPLLRSTLVRVPFYVLLIAIFHNPAVCLLPAVLEELKLLIHLRTLLVGRPMVD